MPVLEPVPLICKAIQETRMITLIYHRQIAYLSHTTTGSSTALFSYSAIRLLAVVVAPFPAGSS